MGTGELSRQKSTQRHDAFTMNRTGQFGLPLDVDHPLGPNEGPRGDSGRTAERIVAHLMHGEPVDLSHDFGVETHQQGALSDLVLDPFLREV